jgi:hypothetical protein
MCERLKQAVLKLACLLAPVFGIDHLESASAALFGWIRVFGTRICDGLCNDGLGHQLNALLLGVQTAVRFHFLFHELVCTHSRRCF